MVFEDEEPKQTTEELGLWLERSLLEVALEMQVSKDEHDKCFPSRVRLLSESSGHLSMRIVMGEVFDGSEMSPVAALKYLWKGGRSSSGLSKSSTSMDGLFHLLTKRGVEQVLHAWMELLAPSSSLSLFTEPPIDKLLDFCWRNMIACLVSANLFFFLQRTLGLQLSVVNVVVVVVAAAVVVVVVVVVVVWYDAVRDRMLLSLLLLLKSVFESDEISLEKD